MKKILKNVLLFSALIGSVNCLALPAAAVDVATATSYMETTDDSKYPSSGTCASGATWTYDYPNRELHISGSTIRIDEMPQLPCRKIVFEKFAKEGITIFELKKSETTLEDAFIDLIKDKGGNK